MNKNFKKLGTVLACLALAGTCIAAPHGGNHARRAPAPAPTHHAMHGGHRHAPPPPPPATVHRHHHGHHHTGALTLGAAVIGGLVGALLSR